MKESNTSDKTEDTNGSSNDTRQKIIPGLIETELKNSYIDYAMSVIVGRALPDVRDGLKPVHRRILYAMHDMGIKYNTSFKKCARIVGEVLGKYHPHGDTAVYDSLVRMAQDFSLRYPLVHGQGNFGSIDGDNPAAMRYTEARLKKISHEMLQDIEKDTVEFQPNFDGSLQEPVVLPSKIPNLLVNGSSGIAVGMATNIPPHNLKEVAQGVIHLIKNPESELNELIEIIKGPDFPTAGIINGRNGIISAYNTGRGKIHVRGKIIEEERRGKNILVIKEIPYMLNKSLLLQEIVENIKTKRIIGVSDLRDESDRNGIRVVLELKKDTDPDVVKNLLFKYTRLQDTFGIIFLALVNNEPRVLSLKQMLMHYIEHRKSMVIARAEFDLKKAEKRAHILEGLRKALGDINNVVALIKSSKSAEQAKENLISKYQFTKEQALAILDMKLQKLAALEHEKIIEEYKKLISLIKDIKEILASEQKVLDIIVEELEEVIKEYGDDRKTEIIERDDDIEIEDMIKEEDVVVTVSHSGYIKRQEMDMYKTQGRGGKGVIGASTREEDFIEELFIANTHSYLMIFSDKGKVYWLKVYSIPQGSRQSRGKPIINLLGGMEKGEKISAVIPVRQFDDQHYLLMATKKGLVKKTNLQAYSRPRKTGIIGINLEKEDLLVEVALTNGENDIILATSNGRAVRFNEKQVRSVGRNSKGVRGATLRHDFIIGMILADPEKKILTITENGYGKKTLISEYRHTNRGGVGVINIKCSERNGKVVAVKQVTDQDELMLISRKGIVIRTASRNISTIGRNTQGVRIMKLKADDKVVSAALIKGDGEEVEEQQ